ncbi:MAG: sensor histidine kinase KdpD [Chloroflexi bacterium]|nr:sensor histidine kinase KdpD [Chloroflexota bacterium]
MTEEYPRPSADELLARIKAEEAQEKRGKLKIFLGYAAGVGKTYTMLDAARVMKKDTDIVVAVVETHGRAETEALMEGLEVIPRRQINYRGIKLSEMDLDAVLERHPKLALVDELAHENAPESRHAKRYQDVEELLSSGIDVYTTLNIQHVESLRDAVAQITGVWVREAVPDSVIDSAAEIELVDLPPDELLKRLKEGKVYVPEQIALAIDQFFQKGNLIALRELTMRIAAKHVDEQTLAYMKAHAIRGPWPSGERLLVCISSDSLGTRLIRSARRLAYELGAEWAAIYVETPEHVRLSSEQQDQLTETLHLAQRLGAKTVTLQGDSIAKTIMQYAADNNISKIVVSRPQKGYAKGLFRRSLTDQLLRQGENFDIHVVSRGEVMRRSHVPAGAFVVGWQGHLQGLGLIALATALGKLVPEFFAPANMIMLYLLCVLVTAFLWGFGPSVLVSVISVLIFDFLFTPPFYTFTVYDTRYIFTFIVLLLAGLVISFLMRRIHDHAEAATRHERQTSALYALGRDLAASNSLESYVIAIVRRLKETFERDAIIFLPAPTNRGEMEPYADRPDVTVSENEMAAAVWSFQHQRSAGRGTDTLPNAAARYLPLVTGRGTVGVLSLSANDSGRELTIEQERLLGAYADLTAVALEGIQLEEEAHNAKVLSQVLRDAEKLQTALINSISHDLRTPLVSIIGTLSSLQEEGMRLDDASRRNMIQVAREEADRLNRLIANLLDVSRLEAGALKINRQPADAQDLVGAALEQLGDRARARPITVDLTEGLPFASVDFGLTVQTLVNVLDNALKYSPADSPIEIRGRHIDHEIHIEVADRGPGILPQDLEHVFDKFYRIQRPDKVTGTGLGLSISRGIVEAQGGRIAAENRHGGGTVISITLPADESRRSGNGNHD